MRTFRISWWWTQRRTGRQWCWWETEIWKEGGRGEIARWLASTTARLSFRARRFPARGGRERCIAGWEIYRLVTIARTWRRAERCRIIFGLQGTTREGRLIIIC